MDITLADSRSFRTDLHFDFNTAKIPLVPVVPTEIRLLEIERVDIVSQYRVGLLSYDISPENMSGIVPCVFHSNIFVGGTVGHYKSNTRGIQKFDGMCPSQFFGYGIENVSLCLCIGQRIASSRGSLLRSEHSDADRYCHNRDQHDADQQFGKGKSDPPTRGQ